MEKFQFNKSDKIFLVVLLSIDGVGRKTALKILKTLKKYELKNDKFWVNKLSVLKKCNIRKDAFNKILIYKNEQEVYSKYFQLKKRNIRVIGFWEKEYPPLLKQTDDFPLLLFSIGNHELLVKDAISVVGTRRITPYGERATKKIVSDLVANDFVIVSGFMYGVDLCSHLAALNNDGQTIAVLGFGFDHMYPKSHKRYFKDFLKRGACFVSEYMPEVEPARQNFPTRNRIVAGISKGVIVAEAAQKSGSHITAQCALDAGREVFAVPGPITNPYSEGTKWLINQGAKLITSGSDVVAEFYDYYRIRSPEKMYSNFSGLEQKLLELLYIEALTEDQLAKKTKLNIQKIITNLSILEVSGVVEKSAQYWNIKL